MITILYILKYSILAILIFFVIRNLCRKKEEPNFTPMTKEDIENEFEFIENRNIELENKLKQLGFKKVDNNFELIKYLKRHQYSFTQNYYVHDFVNLISKRFVRFYYEISDNKRHLLKGVFIFKDKDKLIDVKKGFDYISLYDLKFENESSYGYRMSNLFKLTSNEILNPLKLANLIESSEWNITMDYDTYTEGFGKPYIESEIHEFLKLRNFKLTFYNRLYPNYLKRYFEQIIYEKEDYEIEVIANYDRDGKRICYNIYQENNKIKYFFSGYSSNMELVNNTTNEFIEYMKNTYS